MRNLYRVLIALVVIGLFNDIAAMKRRHQADSADVAGDCNTEMKKQRLEEIVERIKNNISNSQCLINTKKRKRQAGDIRDEKRARDDNWDDEKSWADIENKLLSHIKTCQLDPIIQKCIKMIQLNPKVAYERICHLARKIDSRGESYEESIELRDKNAISIQLSRFIADLLIKLGQESLAFRKILYICVPEEVSPKILHTIIICSGRYDLYLDNLISIVSNGLKRGDLKTLFGSICVLDDRCFELFVIECTNNILYRIFGCSQILTKNSEYTFLVIYLLLIKYVRQDHITCQRLTRLMENWNSTVSSLLNMGRGLTSEVHISSFRDICHDEYESDKETSSSDPASFILAKIIEEINLYTECVQKLVVTDFNNDSEGPACLSEELVYVASATKKFKELINGGNQFYLRALLLLIVFSRRMIQELKIKVDIMSREETEFDGRSDLSSQEYSSYLSRNLVELLAAKLNCHQSGQDNDLINLEVAFNDLSVHDEEK